LEYLEKASLEAPDVALDYVKKALVEMHEHAGDLLDLGMAQVFKDNKNDELSLLECLNDIFMKNVNSSEKFERQTFNALKYLLDKNAPFTYEKDNIHPEEYNAGSLKYDAPLKELPPNHCNFHISNAVCPRSIFEERTYLPECFMTLMNKSEKEYGYDILRTYTWLNSHPKWLDLFPDEWKNNMSGPDNEIWNNLGYWGQLITARKTFNSKTAGYIRTNCELKYKPRASWCSFNAMREHLNNVLQGAI
jgi:hypothetical protein